MTDGRCNVKCLIYYVLNFDISDGQKTSKYSKAENIFIQKIFSV